MKKLNIMSKKFFGMLLVFSIVLFARSTTANAASTMGASTFTINSSGPGATGVAVDIQPAVTATSGGAYGLRLQQTYTAAGDGDVLNGLYIDPDFDDGIHGNITHNALAVTRGNVGFGTTAPDTNLTVVENHVGETGVAVYNDTDGNASRSGFIAGTSSRSQTLNAEYFAPSYTEASWANKASVQASPGTAGLLLSSYGIAGQIQFQTGGSAQSNIKITIDSNGNLGLGTPSPLFPLHVFKSSASINAPIDVATFEASNLSGSGGFLGFGPAILFKDAGGGPSHAPFMGRIAAVYEANSTNFSSGLAFYTNPGTGPSDSTVERLRIDKSGHLILKQPTPPTPSVTGSGYSAASIAGTSTDAKGAISATVGAAAGTLVVTFQAAYTAAPICTVTPATATAQVDITKMYATSTMTDLTLNFAASPTGGAETWNYICVQ